MPTIIQGKLKFIFPDGWSVSKYDEWIYYRKQFINICGGAKAIDVLGIEKKECCWLLEVKDYRQHRRTKTLHLADEVAMKIRDTVAGLVGAQFYSTDDTERRAARQAVRVKNIRVVLHLEQPAKHSTLFPRAINPSVVLQRLKQLIKAVDPHPKVVRMGQMADIPWRVESPGSPDDKLPA